MLLEADPTWLGEKALVIDALKTFIVFLKPEFYGPLLDDTNCMKLMDGNDQVQLRAYEKKVGITLAVGMVDKVFLPRPCRPEPRPCRAGPRPCRHK